METNILPQIHKISRITDSYGITTYLGRTFNNNEVPLEQYWIRENFEFSEPDLYKQVKDRRSDLTLHKTYTVPVGRCSLNTSQEKHNYLDMHSKAFTSLGKSNNKKQQMPDGPTIKYSQGIQNSCILSSLALAFYYMGDVHASEYIIRRKRLSLNFIHDKGRMEFLRNTLMGINREKNNQKYIIKFRNGKKIQRHLIYYRIILIIQLCVCY